MQFPSQMRLSSILSISAQTLLRLAACAYALLCNRFKNNCAEDFSYYDFVPVFAAELGPAICAHKDAGARASISNTVSHVRIYGGNCISYIHFIVLVRHKRNLVLLGSTAKRPFECSVAA